MADCEITIRNYRNIPYENPITLEVRDGITFILGPNNIGKTNILRLFFELGHVFHSSNFSVTEGHRNFSFRAAISPSSFEPFYSVIKNQRSKNKSIEVSLKNKNVQYRLFLSPVSTQMNDTGFQLSVEKTGSNNINFIPKDELGIVGSLFTSSIHFGSFRTPLFSSTGSYFGMSVGQAFVSNWNSWASGSDPIQRTKIIELKKELSELFGIPNFNISVANDKNNLIIETKDGSFHLDEMGGGIGHYVFVLGTALIAQPDFIFIDEPENALHPKMQQQFVRALAAKAKIGLIATSHSIGLARSVADNILTLSKDQSGNYKLSQFGGNYTPSIALAISELGYSQHAELGGNHILLVEGKTDVKSFQEILRKFKIEQEFIVLNLLHGSEFIKASTEADIRDELSELKRLNAKSYTVIFDSERCSKDEPLKVDFQPFLRVCHELGFKIFPTEFHSTENYLSQEAIDEVLGPGYKALGPYEPFKEATKRWSKNQNWRVFRAMTKSDFEDTELYRFIVQELAPLAEH